MLQDYLKELSKVELLKKDQEMALWMRYKDHEDMLARAALIEAYQPLVFKLVMKMQPKEDLILDLIQEASIGLIEAVERFNYRKGIAFPSYASFRIRGQIINFFQKINFDIVSLDQTYPSSEDDLPLLYQLAEESPSSEPMSLERYAWQEPLQDALSRLPDKEKKIIKALFFDDREPQKVAEELQVSLPHLYRLQKKALRRIRGMLSKLRHEFKIDGK